MNALRIYIGYDGREPDAYDVAIRSLERHATMPVCVTPLDVDRLRESGVLNRPTDKRGERRGYDILSNAPVSTDFAISRFLVPHLAQDGWALFVDSDVVFLGDVAELFTLADPRYAIQCVQHPDYQLSGVKMDGQAQTRYSRKFWSSVVLWNCSHPANKRLSLHDVQNRKGLDLHAFYWLADSEIGELPAEWNWLVNVAPEPAAPKLAHFTLGGPFSPGWEGAEHDGIWYAARGQARAAKVLCMARM